MSKKSKKTPGYSSPKGGNRGCACADGTYSIDCCDGSLQAQGVGVLVTEAPNYVHIDLGNGARQIIRNQ